MDDIALYCTIIATVVSVITLLTGFRRFEKDQLRYRAEREAKEHKEAAKQERDTVRHRTEINGKIDRLGEAIETMRTDVRSLEDRIGETQSNLSKLERRHDRDIRDILTLMMDRDRMRRDAFTTGADPGAHHIGRIIDGKEDDDYDGA